MKSNILVLLVFFLFKVAENLFQPSICIEICNLVCELESNGTIFAKSCRNTDIQGNVHPSARYMEEENRIQTIEAKYLLAYRMLLNLPALFVSFMCGSLSDRFGRLYLMLIPSIGATLACCLITASLATSLLPSITAILILLAGTGIWGILGKGSVLTMACYSYVTDVTPTNERTKYMARLMGINYFGTFVGNLITGLYQQYLSFNFTIITVSLINFVVIGIVAFFMDESHTPTRYIEANVSNIKKRSCTQFWKESFHFMVKKREGRNRLYLLFLIFACLFSEVTKLGERDLILLYVTHDPLRWQDQLYGYYLAVYYACLGINVVVILPLIQCFFKPSDTTLIMVGLLFKSVRLLLTGLFPQTSILFAAAVMGSSAGFIIPSVRSMISKCVDPEEVGKAFSLISGIESLSGMLGNAIFTGLYIATLSISPGFVFLVDVVAHLSMFICFLWLHFEFKKNKGNIVD